MKSRAEKVLLLSKRNKKSKKLEHCLVDYFDEVRLVSDSDEMRILPSNNHFKVIIFTDSFGFKVNNNFIFNLRNKYPHAKILCLIDEVSHEMEVVIRGAGPVYMGSYNRFFRLSKDILQAAIGSRKQIDD